MPDGGGRRHGRREQWGAREGEFKARTHGNRWGRGLCTCRERERRDERARGGEGSRARPKVKPASRRSLAVGARPRYWKGRCVLSYMRMYATPLSDRSSLSADSRTREPRTRGTTERRTRATRRVRRGRERRDNVAGVSRTTPSRLVTGRKQGSFPRVSSEQRETRTGKAKTEPRAEFSNLPVYRILTVPWSSVVPPEGTRARFFDTDGSL